MKSIKTREYLFLGLLVAMVGIIGFSVLGPTKSQKQVLTEEQKRLLNYNLVEAGEETIDGTDKVTFDAFFLRDIDNDGNAEGLRGISKEIGSQEQLWLELRVLGDVTLKDAEIKFVNANSKISGKIIKDTTFKSTINSSDIRSIPLNNVNNGTTKTFYLNVNTNLTNDITSYTGINKVVLTGTVVGNDGSVTEIRKEVPYQVDWYGSIKAGIGDNTYDSAVSATSSGSFQQVKYEFKTYATDKLLLKSAYIKGKVGTLNGYEAVNVKVEGTNVEYTWDEATQIFEAKREAKLNENVITSQAYSYVISSNSQLINEWKIVVEYPKEAGLENTVATASVEAWYEAYNNPNPEYENIIESNHPTKILSRPFNMEIVRSKCHQSNILNEVSIGSTSSLVGKYIPKTNLYSFYNTHESGKTTNYNVNWRVVLSEYSEDNNIKKVIFYDNGGDTVNDVSLKPYVKYKTISFSGVNQFLGSSGYIKLINADTEEVIHIFTALDWNTTYQFDSDVRSIKIETSAILDTAIQKTWNFKNKGCSDIDLELFDIRMTKTIDNEAMVNNIPFEEWDKYSHITSKEITTQYNDEIYHKNVEIIWKPMLDDARYMIGVTNSELSVSNNDGTSENKSTFESTKDVKANILINTNSIDGISEGWVDGEFLVVLPKEILDVKIDNITINNSNIEVVGTEISTIAGQKYVKILTNNISKVPSSYQIKLETTLTPDARATNKYIYFELFGYNPNCENYQNKKLDIYDLNNNGITSDYVSYHKYQISLVSPIEVITTTTLTNYHDENVTVSPLIAEVNPVLDDKQATVTVGITNNSGYSIKNIVVIGKLAYEGNKYQIATGDLGSKYDVKMQSGIVVPEEIQDKTKVYYTEVETPTEDLTDTANGWIEEPTSFDDIKTYMIIIENHTMANGKQYLFDYDIEMDNKTSNMFKNTYFTHGVYYEMITPNGDHETSVEGSKLGITMVRKYKLNLNVYKTASNTKVEKSRYLITDEDGNEYIITTDKNGNAILDGLYVDKEYTIRNISVPYNYAKDEEIKTFKVVNNVDDSLEPVTNGNFNRVEYTNNNVLNIDLENETRYTIILKNTDFDTNANVANSTFTITGKGYESGYAAVTDENGELKLKGLYLNEVYEVEQVNAPKYLKTEKFRIKLIRDEDKEIKITVETYPVVSDILPYSTYVGSSYTFEKQNNGTYFADAYTSNTAYGIVNIDLRNLKDNYKFVINYNIPSRATLNVILFKDTLKAGTTILGDDYKKSITGSSNSTSIITSAQDLSSDNFSDWKVVPIKGGSEYIAYLSLSRNNPYSYSYINSISIEPVSGKLEMLPTGTNENVVIPDNNDRVVQTLNDSEGLIQPELTVNVKNKAIPTYTFEIHKTDAESGESLAGAQYKITGPGLPASGKYLTTDADGKASIELYQKIIGDSDYTEDELSQFETEYEIEEIVAPSGYTLDNRKIQFESYQNNDATAIAFKTDEKFKNYTFDNSNKATAEVVDYPLIKIVKKDAETGEVLPNTLFAIYELQYVNSIEVLTPAKDVNGNIVGQEVEINGRSYQLVSTNEKGEISLNLSKGQYKIQEIQAANEKYELDSGVYYFGVGENIPYQPSSMDLSYVIYPDNFYTNYSLGNYYTQTKDGGWIMTESERTSTATNSRIVKYDSEGNIEWTYDEPIVHTYGDDMRYYDNPEKNFFKQGSKYNYGFSEIIEASDGGYFVSENYHQSIIIKLDKDGNFLWQNRENQYGYVYSYEKVCRYDENENLKDAEYDAENHIIGGKVKEWYYSDSNDEWYGSSYYSTLYDYMLRDDETYYCGRKSLYNVYTGDSRTVMTALPDGGVAMLIKTYGSSDGRYRMEFADGTYKTVENSETIYMIIYDKEGHLTDAIDMKDAYKITYNQYKERYSIDSSSYSSLDSSSIAYSYLGTYPNGDILFVQSYGHDTAIKLHKNETTGKYEPSWFIPIGVNGKEIRIDSSNGDDRVTVQLLDDGGFYLSVRNGYGLSSSGSSDIHNAENLQYELPPYKSYYDTASYYQGGDYHFVFEEFDDEDGNKNVRLKDIVVASTYYKYVIDEVFGYNETNKMMYEIYYYRASYRLPDGSYINAGPISGLYSSMPEQNKAKVLLANGSTKMMSPDTTFVIYKQLPNGEIEWIKEYKGIDKFNAHAKIRLSADGTKLLVPVKVKANSILEEIGNDDIPLIQNTTSSDKYAFLVYELNDEVLPESPEAYTLNINNKRKEYKVNIETDLGGNIEITNPNGNKVYEGNGPTTVEKVKYGDDNQNIIKITPDENYIITGVTVNGEEHSFKVNDDGSIIVDTIKDIKENKDIKITVVNGLSSVIVHHYKENTTDRVASDEVLTGMVLTPYETEPVTSKLYSLVLDDNGEAVIPNNYKGTFNTEKQVVTYYYKENEVDLEIHYYVNDTEIELAPSKVETYVLGAQYRTSALNIEFYELAKVIGEEEGTLEDAKTTVTYFYNELTESTITTRYVDKATGKDIVEPIVQIVDRHADYETTESDKIPANYRFVSKTSNATGKAENQNIEVIYYYEEIEFNVSVDKKINTILVNGEKVEITDAKLAKIEPKKEDSVIVYYDIILKNSGELRATFKVSEQDVENFTIYDLGDFVKEEGSYVLTVELEPGEEKTYKIGYKWNQKDYGISKNKVELKEVGNELGIKEKGKDQLDNISETEVVLGVPTGMNIKLTIIIITSIIISGGIVTITLTKGRIKK